MNLQLKSVILIGYALPFLVSCSHQPTNGFRGDWYPSEKMVDAMRYTSKERGTSDTSRLFRYSQRKLLSIAENGTGKFYDQEILYKRIDPSTIEVFARDSPALLKLMSNGKGTKENPIILKLQSDGNVWSDSLPLLLQRTGVTSARH